MSFDYDLKSNLVATISNHSQSQSKLQLNKQTGLLSPLVNQLDIDKNHKLSEWVPFPSSNRVNLISSFFFHNCKDYESKKLNGDNLKNVLT